MSLTLGTENPYEFKHSKLTHSLKELWIRCLLERNCIWYCVGTDICVSEKEHLLDFVIDYKKHKEEKQIKSKYTFR